MRHDLPEERLAEIASLIVTIGRYIQENEQRTAGVVRLRPLEVLVLRAVERNPGISPGQLARRVRIKPSNASAALASLEQRGMIERSVDDHDARSVRVQVTPLADANIASVRAVDRDLLEGLIDDRDSPVLLDLLGRLELALTNPDDSPEHAEPV